MLDDFRAYGEKSIIPIDRYLEALKRCGRLPKRRLPPKAVLLYSPSAIHSLRKKTATERAPFFTGEVDFLNEAEFSSVCVVHHLGFGGPAAALFVEKLIALGVRELVIVGTAGAMPAENALAVGEVALTPWALRDDGVSDHYLPKNQKVSASPRLLKNLKAKLEALNVNEAPVWTTDAFYRETPGNVRQAVAAGARLVEMEAASIFAVGEYHQCDAAAVFVVSDRITANDWVPQFNEIGPRLSLVLEAVVKALAKGES